MMEGQNGSILSHKPRENGVKGKHPYSVETPYGFRLDLDFLKYVDDIEKGNTIKRVPIQRRSKGPRASTLPRNLNPSGGGYRPSPWGSTGALGPRSRLLDTYHHGYNSSANGHRSPLSPTGLTSLAEMEARIKEFDEQPLGEHIRPHLLRASSLPLTVLLRQSSESTDDPGSLRSSRDHLGDRNVSCEDILFFSDSPRPQDCSGLWRRLTEALERVGELEMEIRVIPELKAQICILQEERDRLRLGLNQQTHHPSMNGTTNSTHYGTDIKRPRHETHNMFSRNHGFRQEDPSLSHEWRTSTDLDELLTVTSLQTKVAVLEQKLHETGLELQQALGQLREQQDESRRKEEKIEHLVRNPGVWVRAERVVVDQDGDETVVRSIEPCDEVSLSYDAPHSARTVFIPNQQKDSDDPNGRSELEPASEDGIDTTVVVHHINKIRRLLNQQWECFCADYQPPEEGKPLKHPDPKVNSLQQEMLVLVDKLTSYYTQSEHSDGQTTQHQASKSITRTDPCPQMSGSLHSEGVNEGDKSTTSVDVQRCVIQPEKKEDSFSPWEMAPVQVDTHSKDSQGTEERQMSPDRQMISGGVGSGQTDGGVVSAEAETQEETAKSKPPPPREQMEGSPGSESSTGGRDTVSTDFMTACQFLKDHMDNMDNPNDDMRKALVVCFQYWFNVAALETSEASTVAVLLKEVKKVTPSLLAFLVNLADDNSNTVLHYCVSHCNFSIISQLLDTGVSDLNIQNNAGYTPVMLASLTAPDGPGGMEVVRKLMEMGNIHTRSSKTGQTALHLAVRHGRVVIVRLLLSCGADANIQDNQGTTALMFAAERGHTHITRLLLERSQCDLTLTDKRGRTALSIAMQGSHTDTATLLQAHAKARAL
ncbi:KN motif and ankyrin repeat domain-containing protein 2-like [Halichoeres trimaculatus]|uniref:KN motif and ankyrin repeat domain-containing protein 2-like n=1 Tax=Halichoeres trimaculatus TaxID=147232 RepID=UPI003D9EC75C